MSVREIIKSVITGPVHEQDDDDDTWITVESEIAVGFQDMDDAKQFQLELRALVRKHTKMGFDYDIESTAVVYNSAGKKLKSTPLA